MVRTARLEGERCWNQYFEGASMGHIESRKNIDTPIASHTVAKLITQNTPGNSDMPSNNYLNSVVNVLKNRDSESSKEHLTQ